MIQELVKAFVLVFIAEMGDKTQILAMAFATKYPVRKVLLGIFLGVVLNHGLAVMLGSYISNFIPINTIQIVAGFAFVGFALWTLKSDEEEEEEANGKAAYGPVITVAAAFFIGELGDKTQLTAITLAADAAYPLAILGGTVLGMLVTGGIGIFVGRKLGDKIPEFTIKIIAASVFMFFGCLKLVETLPKSYLTPVNITVFAGIIGISIFLILRPEIIRRRGGQDSLYIRKSRELNDYYKKVQKRVEGICLGKENCGECQGQHCIVGHTKLLIEKGMDTDKLKPLGSFTPQDGKRKKEYNHDKVLEALRVTLEFIKDDPDNRIYENIHEIRRNFERILFNGSVNEMSDWHEYMAGLESIHEGGGKGISKKQLQSIYDSLLKGR